MATVTHVCTLDYVAKMLDEDPELLEAIVYNDDNLSYGSIISVYTGPDDTITALTDDGIDELKDMLRDARITPETWHAFLDDFVDDAELVAAAGIGVVTLPHTNLWLGGRDDLCVVGDPAQTIYSFAGADSGYLRQRFPARFPGATSIELVRNYRFAK